jgi:TusA-related sulfurtransferase
VLTTKKALEEIEQGEFILIVDNPGPRDNVERFAQSQGAIVGVEKKERNFISISMKEVPAIWRGPFRKPRRWSSTLTLIFLELERWHWGPSS